MKATRETRKAILETARRLDDLGIEAKDMQFLITKDGKAVLFDLGEFKVRGAPIPYLARGELKAEVLRNRGLNLSDEGIRVIHRETSNLAYAEALVQALP